MKINWRYALGELLLLFIGINLAIWFNNWNSSKQLNKNKATAIESIQNEIDSNRDEIQRALERNQEILSAFNLLSAYYEENTSNVVTTPKEMRAIMKRYPGFFSVEDSIRRQDGRFWYKGTTSMRLEIPSISDVAWETTQAIGLSAEFDFQCLFNLERSYSLQTLVQQQVGKATDALQSIDVDALLRAIDFSNQLSEQWLQLYDDNLSRLNTCL